MQEKDFECPEIYQYYSKSPIVKACTYATFVNSPLNTTCVQYCTDPPISSNLYIVYLAMIPLLLQGISYMIVYLTMLEFICAQSPNETKGLLIGIGYSLISIKYLINIVDKQSMLLNTTTTWCIKCIY